MNRTSTALVLVALPVLLAFSQRRYAVALGKIEMKGGTESVTVDTAAIAPGRGDELVGSITNSTRRPIDGITVRVVRDGEKASPPTSAGDTTVDDAGGSSSGDNLELAEGFAARIDLTGGVGLASPLAPHGKAELGIDVGDAGDGSSVEVAITPSVSDKPRGTQRRADVLAGLELGEAAPRATRALAAAFHDRASVLVTNAGEKAIASLAGTCSALPGRVTLSSVHLQDPSSGSVPVPSATSVDGGRFSVAGFTALAPGETYELVLVFAGTPPDGYEVGVEASY